MSIFSSIGNFFKKLFGKLRPGLDSFLQQYKDIAVKEVEKLALLNSNKDFHEWKDSAWSAINAQLDADGKKIAGNWISIILHLAFEEIKAKIEIENKK